MNAQNLRDAAVLHGALSARARQIALDELASRLRSNGLEATLGWLLRPDGRDRAEKAELARQFCAALGLPEARDARGRRSNPELLNDQRLALALAEALHLYARAPR